MSSFSNLLNSLGGPQQPIPSASASSTTPATSRPKPPVNPARQASHTAQVPATGIKRKHDAFFEPQPPASVQYRGTGPQKAIQGQPGLNSPAQARPPLDTKESAQGLPTPSSKPTPLSASSEGRAPPPKNSYRAIMARAQAAQSKPQEFGQIKHKAVQKPGRHIGSQTPDKGGNAKDRNESAKSPDTQKKQGAQTERGGAAATAMGAKPKRKPLDLGYKGTMRSAPGSTDERSSKSPANAASRPKLASSASMARLPERHAQRRPSAPEVHEKRYRYAAESDEEEDEEDYEDDEDEDMDGGGYDELMQEEAAAEREAKKEDAEELRLETEHKRQKAAKKDALARLAEARRGKSGV